MDNETLTALTALATKLGTTSEYLWSVLLKQAPISGMTDLILITAMITLTAIYTRLVIKYFPELDEDSFGAWAVAAILVSLSTVITLSSAGNIIAALFNPEYWALRQILHP